MIKVQNNVVEVGVPKEPLVEQLYKISESATVKAILVTEVNPNAKDNT